MELTKYKLGKLIEQCDNRNTDEEYTADDVRGISTGKEFIETKANMDGVSLNNYKVVEPGMIAFISDIVLVLSLSDFIVFDGLIHPVNPF